MSVLLKNIIWKNMPDDLIEGLFIKLIKISHALFRKVVDSTVQCII